MSIYKWRCKFNNTKSKIFGFGKSGQTCTLLWPAQLDTFLSTKLTQLYTLSFHFLSYPQTLTEQWTNYPQLKLLFALISVGDRHVYIALQSMHTTSNSSILWQNWNISSWTFIWSAIYKLSIILGVPTCAPNYHYIVYCWHPPNLIYSAYKTPLLSYMFS